MPTESPDEFRDSLSLNSLAVELAGSLKSRLPENRRKFCLGVHVRHVFDTASPTVYVCSSNEVTASRIRETNERLGKQTLNHVLDALLGSHVAENVAGVAACVTVEFKDGECDGDGHPFACEDAGVQKELKAEFERVSLSFTGDKEACAALCFQSVLKSKRPRPEDYLWGTSKLCKQLNIAVTPMALDSIWSAIVQLGRFSGKRNFGCHTITCLLRSPDPFGFVVGFTLVTSAKIEIASLEQSFSYLQQAQTSLNRKLIALPVPNISRPCEIALHTIAKFRGMWRPKESGELFLPQKILHQLRDDLIDGISGYDFEFKTEPSGILSSIETFIHLASRFCDEKIEGRQLRFGLVHGNPALLFHWHGPSPIPLAIDNNTFFALKELPKQFHLIEDPEDRCLVIPYLPPMPDTHSPMKKPPTRWEVLPGDAVPAFALELRHFKQAFAESDIIQFWSEEFRPYAYFTGRHRWAVACVVGPYSEMRVFTAGTLSAYRDGKGWKILRKPGDGAGPDLQPWEHIVHECPQWRGKRILRVLIELAIQLSPIANRHAKGGMLLFSPVEHNINEEVPPIGGRNLWFNEKGERVLQDLRAKEPTSLRHRFPVKNTCSQLRSMFCIYTRQ